MQTDEQSENTSTLTSSEAAAQRLRVNVNEYEVQDMLAVAREQDEKRAGLGA